MSLTSSGGRRVKRPLCCVPSCSSTDIKAEKHEFTWEVIYDSMGIAGVESPVTYKALSTNIYRMLNAKLDACISCGVL